MNRFEYMVPLSANGTILQVGDRIRATKWLSERETGWLGTVKEVGYDCGLGSPIPNCIRVDFDNEPGAINGFAAQLVEFVERP